MTKEEIIEKAIFRTRIPSKKKQTKKERLAYWREYSKKEWSEVYTLTESEKIALGLKKKPVPVKDLIRVVVPEHYGAAGVIWQSRNVTPAALEGLRAQYPNLEIVEGRSI